MVSLVRSQCLPSLHAAPRHTATPWRTQALARCRSRSASRLRQRAPWCAPPGASQKGRLDNYEHRELGCARRAHRRQLHPRSLPRRLLPPLRPLPLRSRQGQFINQAIGIQPLSPFPNYNHILTLPPDLGQDPPTKEYVAARREQTERRAAELRRHLTLLRRIHGVAHSRAETYEESRFTAEARGAHFVGLSPPPQSPPSVSLVVY